MLPRCADIYSLLFLLAEGHEAPGGQAPSPANAEKSWRVLFVRPEGRERDARTRAEEGRSDDAGR